MPPIEQNGAIINADALARALRTAGSTRVVTVDGAVDSPGSLTRAIVALGGQFGIEHNGGVLNADAVQRALANIPPTGGSTGPVLPGLGNLIANWKADAIPVQANGTSLASWTDSISGIVASQGTGAAQPTYTASAAGGKPGVQFSGTQWLPIATPGAIDTAIASGNYTILFAIDNVLSQVNGTVFGASAGGNSQLYAATGSTVGRYDGGYLNHSVPATGNATPLGFTTFGATSQKPYPFPTGGGSGLERIVVRGGIVGGLGSPGPAATSTYAIGSLNANGTPTNFNLKGRVYEVLFWNRPLTPGELLQAEAYLCTKYSQTIPYSQGTYFLAFDGDSQTFNVGTTAITFGYPYLAITTLGLGYGQWTNTAVGGIAQETMISKVAELSAVPAQVSQRVVIAAFEYYNSHLASDTGATMYANAGTYVSTAKALGSNVRVVWGSDLSSSADPQTDRTTYNALLDATPVGDQYVAMHVDINIGISGAEAANPSLYADGIHLNNTGQPYNAAYWPSKITAASTMA